MKIAIFSLFCLLSVTSFAFASALVKGKCSIKVTDTSDIGVYEDAVEKTVKSESTDIELYSSKCESYCSPEIYFSLSSSKDWNNYLTIGISAAIDENGLFSGGTVMDEVKNIAVPMSLSADKKQLELEYNHGGPLPGDTFVINTNCKID